MSGQSVSLPVLPLERRSFGAILRDTWTLYRRHGLALTRVLLKPMLQIILCAYGSASVGYLIIDYLITNHVEMVAAHPWVPVIAMLPPSILLLYFFCSAFWSYLIYFVSLNINVAELLQGKAPDFKKAYESIHLHKNWPYSTLLIVYCVLAGVLSIASLILLVVLLMGFIGVGAVSGGISDLKSVESASYPLLVISSLAFVPLNFLTLVYQILAFEPVTLNPLPILLKSTRMVWGHFWRTLGLQVILLVLTGYLLPLLAIQLANLTHFNQLLDGFHSWLMDLILKGAAPYEGMEAYPFYPEIYAYFEGQKPEIIRNLTETLLSVTVNGLLLPLGTIAFTLLYLDIRAGRE